MGGGMQNIFKYFRFIIICPIFFSYSVDAQWVQFNLPVDVNTLSFAIKDSILFAATGGSGVFSSTNNGNTWEELNDGLTNKYVHTILIDDLSMYAGTTGGVLNIEPLSIWVW